MKQRSTTQTMHTAFSILLAGLLSITSLQAQCLEGDCREGEGVFLYPDSKRYLGSFAQGQPHGEGVLIYPDGSRYQGRFQAGEPHGNGVLIQPDGSRRTGYWEAGQVKAAQDQLAEWTERGTTGGQGCVSGDCTNGRGVYVSAGGAVYTGEFQNGEIHGQGVCYYPDGSQYSGRWSHRYPDGRGTKTWPDGSFRTGYWHRGYAVSEDGHYLAFPDRTDPSTLTTFQHGCISGDCENGQGVFAYVDGSRYEGQFVNGRPHGEGTFYYPNGDVHHGRFAQGLPHGPGRRDFADGRQERGEWEEGVYLPPTQNQAQNGCQSGDCRNGFGTYFFRGGDRYTGQFMAGKPHGHGQVHYANGDRYEGGMAGGAFSGFGTFYGHDGTLYQGLWEEGNYRGSVPSVMGRPTPQGEAVRIWAVIIGVSAYRHMPALRFPDDDAYRLFAFLKSPEGGAVPDERIRILIDEDATRQRILNTMHELFSQAGPRDLVVLYFSGHGLPGTFLPIDYDGVSNQLRHTEIRQVLDESPAGYKLCLADACHSGGLLTARGRQLPDVLATYYDNLTSTRPGLALIMSSKSDETSLESSGLRQGVFSHFLLRGMKGEADADRDGIVRVQELFAYVEEQVRAYTRLQQSPVIQGNYDERMPVSVLR